MPDPGILAYASPVPSLTLAIAVVWFSRMRRADRALAANVAELFSARMVEPPEPQEPMASEIQLVLAK
jgi:hypothetical protein